LQGSSSIEAAIAREATGKKTILGASLYLSVDEEKRRPLMIVASESSAWSASNDPLWAFFEASRPRVRAKIKTRANAAAVPETIPAEAKDTDVDAALEAGERCSSGFDSMDSTYYR